MRTNSLFRPAALKARQVNSFGAIVLLRPISFRFLTIIAVASAGLVIAILIWGTYTKRSTVAGQLIPDTGLVKVYVPQPGIVLQKFVAEGQHVIQGDVLYLLSSERQSSTQGNIQAAISEQTAPSANLASAPLQFWRNKVVGTNSADFLTRTEDPQSLNSAHCGCRLIIVHSSQKTTMVRSSHRLWISLPANVNRLSSRYRKLPLIWIDQVRNFGDSCIKSMTYEQQHSRQQEITRSLRNCLLRDVV